MIPVHTSIILDTRRELKDGTFPVKLRITYQRQRKYFSTNYTLTEEDYSKARGDKPKGRFKELQLAFQAIEQRAIKAIDQLPVFSFEGFEKKLLNKSVRNEVFSVYEHHIEQLKKDGNASTAVFYESAYFSILSFTLQAPLPNRKGVSIEEIKRRKEFLLTNKKPLLFSSVTIDFLKSYEKWMLNRGKTVTSVSMYLRTLRTLFNEVIATGDLNAELYPFGKRKYQIPASRNIKKAINLSDVEKIFNYKAAHASEEKARDLWVFSYLCNGINMKDIARLKYKQLNTETITFIRAKTERTSKHNLKPIVAIRSHEIDLVIEKWGNKPALPDSYIFPILTDGLTAEQELAKVRQATKTLNKYIDRIATTLGIEKHVTSYTARHTFSTVLKRAGAPTEVISEALGHHSVTTTQNYLDSFDDTTKRHFAKQLTAFKKD